MIEYQRLCTINRIKFDLSTAVARSLTPSRAGGRLKGKGKEVLGARETPGAREEGRNETPARRTLYFSL